MALAYAPPGATASGARQPAAATTLPRLCLVTTSPVVVQRFLIPHLRQLADRFDVTLISSGDCAPFAAGLPRPPRLIRVPIERKIDLLRDPLALIQLARVMATARFDAVITIAPKAGFIGMIAAALTRVPYRCHVFQGEVWATRTGLMRRLLRATDGLVGLLASETLVVSNGERAFLIGEGILSAARSRVLGAGSIIGVDTTRFAPNAEQRRVARAAAGIAEGVTLILFLGRLQRDKGVLDLVAAWTDLARAKPDVSLAVVGPDEEGLTPEIRSSVPAELAGRLHLSGETSAPEHWMAAADILCLPSYREGFGNVIIEAAACAIPSGATGIYGLADAIVDGATGLVYPAGDRPKLTECLARLADDEGLRHSLGAAGRAMAEQDFEQDTVVARYAAHWAERCSAKDRS